MTPTRPTPRRITSAHPAPLPPRRRIDMDLDRASTRLDRASRTVPDVLAHLTEQLRYATYGATDTDTGRISGGNTSDPTYNAMHRRAPVQAFIDDVQAKRAAIGKAIDDLDDACRKALGYRVALSEDTPRCDGGDPSTWGHPTCGQYVEHFMRADESIGFRSEMLCARHRKRKERYERGLEPEEAA